MVLYELRPRADCAGYHHRMRRVLRDRDVSLAVPAGLGRRRRPAGSVERNRRGSPFRRIKRKAIAADPCHQGIGDALHGDRRDSRVDGVAAGAKHFDRDQCRHRVGSRCSRVRGVDRRTAGQKKIAQWESSFRAWYGPEKWNPVFGKDHAHQK